MKFTRILVSLFSLSTVSAFIPSLTPAAKAVCVAVDVPVQVAVHGKDSHVNQVNNTTQKIDPNCFGNTSVHTGTQTYVGNGNADQIRNSTQILGPGHNPLPGGVKTPNIKIQTPVQVKVPALPNR